MVQISHPRPRHFRRYRFVGGWAWAGVGLLTAYLAAAALNSTDSLDNVERVTVAIAE